MADPQAAPQQYTDAQLSDGRTLRFMGDLDPDTVRAKVQTFRAKEAIANNPPPVPRPQVNMQPSMLAPRHDPQLDQNIYQADAANNSTPGDALVSGATLGAGLGAGTAGRAALPFLTQQAAKHPIIATMAAQEAISQARRIPVLGKFVPPYAELLPFMRPGRAAPAEGIERDATRENVPYAGEQVPETPPQPTGAPVYRDATRQNVPYAGEAQQQAAPPPPVTPPFVRQSARWTPPTATVQWPKPGSAEDLAETKQIQDTVRNSAEQEQDALLRLGNQERYPTSTKGELTGSENAPVKLTKTPSASTIKPNLKNPAPAKPPYYLTGGAKQIPGNAAPAPAQSEDLTEEWQKNLDFLKKRKKE